jgi:hypothetical protein
MGRNGTGKQNELVPGKKAIAETLLSGVWNAWT